MVSKAEFQRRVQVANRDPLVRAIGACMWCVDYLFFGRPSDVVWNALCSLQNRRYRALVSLE